MLIILIGIVITLVTCIPVFRQMREHPRGLHILFFAEMWERFSYYGMRALLIYYLTQHFLFSDAFAGSQYGAYTSLVYLMPLIGGYLADKYLGNRKAIAFGALLLVGGHLAMAVEGKAATQILETNGQQYEFVVEGRGNSRQVFMPVGDTMCLLNPPEETDAACTINPTATGDFVFAGLPAASGLPDTLPATDYKLTSTPPNPFFLGVFYLALSLIIMGVGFLKANISSIVGQLYEQGDPKRDPGFTLYYYGINLGAFWAATLCGILGETVGWWAGFGLAGVGMLFGWIVFVRRRLAFWTQGEPQLPDHVGNVPEGVDLETPVFAGMNRERLIYVGAILGVIVTWFLIQSPPVEVLAGVNEFADKNLQWMGGAQPHIHIAILLALGSVVVIGYIVMFMLRECTAVESQRMILAFILVAAATVFWTFFEQAGSSLSLFADRNTQLPTGIFSITASQTQSFNAGFILIFAPVFSALWAFLGNRHMDPNPVLKFGLGLIQLGIGFFILVWGANFADENFQVPLIFLALLYLFHTTGELCLSPVGLSAITKLSVGKVVSTMMAVWFLSSAWAQYVGGIIAGLTETETVAGVALDNEAALNGSIEVFQTLGMIAVGIGIGLSALSFILKRLGHGRAGNIGPRPESH